MSVNLTSFALQFGLGGNYRDTMLANGGAGLYMRFRELIGTTAVDENLGTVHNGTIAGGVTLGQRSCLPEGDLSFLFNGTTGKVTSSYDLTNGGGSVAACGLEALINHNAQSWSAGEETVVCCGAAGTYLAVKNGNIFGSIRVGGVTTTATGGAVSTSGWHLATLSWTSGQKLAVYLDGVLSGQSAGTVTGTLDSSANVYVGVFDGAGTPANWFKGYIDEVVATRTASGPTAATRYAATQWTDVTADTIMESSIKLKYGVLESTTTSRVGGIGELTFMLNNAASNSLGRLGAYSPNNVNVRTGFNIGIPVRVVMTYGGTSYYKWWGKLIEVKPIPGRYQERWVNCVAVDIMDDLTRAPLTAIPTQTSIRSDVLWQTVLQYIFPRPQAISTDTGVDTYVYALDTARDNTMTAMTEAQRIALSELGYITPRGDTSGGGTLAFQSRNYRLNQSRSTTSNITLSDSMTAMDITSARDDVINRVQVQIHPRRVDGSAVVLYAIVNSQSISPGATIPIFGPYRDPNQLAARVGGKDMINPVATTDYLGNTAADGSGTNKTAQLSVSATFGGNGVYFTITNNDAGTVYLTKLQCRGIGLYDFDNQVYTVDDTSSQHTFGINALNLDMPYQSDINVASSAASYLLSVWKTAFGMPKTVTFQATADDARMTAMLQCEPADRISVVETVTGTMCDAYINGVEIDITKPLITCKWHMIPANTGSFWTLDTSTLDNSTTLGFF